MRRLPQRLQQKITDIRNTKIVDIYNTLCEYTHNISVYDSWADAESVKHEYGIELEKRSLQDLYGQFDAVILGVAHDEFKDKDVRALLSDPYNGVVYDVKGILDRNIIDGRL